MQDEVNAGNGLFQRLQERVGRADGEFVGVFNQNYQRAVLVRAVTRSGEHYFTDLLDADARGFLGAQQRPGVEPALDPDEVGVLRHPGRVRVERRRTFAGRTLAAAALVVIGAQECLSEGDGRTPFADPARALEAICVVHTPRAERLAQGAHRCWLTEYR